LAILEALDVVLKIGIIGFLFYLIHYLYGSMNKRRIAVTGPLLKGSSYKEIARSLSISLATVKTHIHNIYVKTGASSRYALIHTIQTW
jgi:DNA-binding NarL/FixJ family response regulator